MRTTIDKAGRIVIPKELRDRAGIVPGEVELVPDGMGLRLEPIAADELIEHDGLLVIPASGTTVTTDAIRALRAADQR